MMKILHYYCKKKKLIAFAPMKAKGPRPFPHIRWAASRARSGTLARHPLKPQTGFASSQRVCAAHFKPLITPAEVQDPAVLRSLTVLPSGDVSADFLQVHAGVWGLTTEL